MTVASPAAAPAALRARVLVAEDDPGLLEAYVDTLGDGGFEVTTASDGLSAQQALEQGRFDVVLSDVVMPGLTGLDLLRSVRDRDLDLPVILVTGSPSVEMAVQAVQLGALSYLLKPVRSLELLQAVRNAALLKLLATTQREVLLHLGDQRTFGDRAGLEAVFNRALGGLYMLYQPIVRARDGSVFAWGALLRTHELAVASPLAFLELAGRLGRLRELGDCIRASVARAAEHAKGTAFFVKLHPDDLLDESLYAPRAPLSRQGPEIILELADRNATETLGDLRERVKRLRRLGFRLAIGDLGAGYAGLASFVTLEPEFVKLGRGLISAIDQEQVKRQLVGSLIRVSHELGMSTIAEGVERPEERQVLAELGCHLMQGYLFQRPEQLRFEPDVLRGR